MRQDGRVEGIIPGLSTSWLRAIGDFSQFFTESSKICILSIQAAGKFGQQGVNRGGIIFQFSQQAQPK